MGHLKEGKEDRAPRKKGVSEEGRNEERNERKKVRLQERKGEERRRELRMEGWLVWK